MDDEPLARECLTSYIGKVDFLELAGTLENPLELDQFLKKETIDLLFLDIQMPMMSGIEYLKTTRNLPMVILTTAFPNYALEGYELDVLDYLLKPITFNRFFKAISKAEDYHSIRFNEPDSPSPTSKEYFFVKCNQVYEKIIFDEVLYVEAQENYVTIHTTSNKYMVLMPMKRIEELLGEEFLRIHKSYIVGINKITSVDRDRLSIGDQTIPISRNYRTTVIEKVVGKQVWKK